MNRRLVIRILITVLLAGVFSWVYFINNEGQYAILGFALAGFAYTAVQFIAGLILTFYQKTREMGRALMIGAGIILLIGFPVCTFFA